MAIAIHSLGTFGDVEPFVSLGRKLQERGEAVYFLGNEIFRAYVESYDLSFIGVSTAEQYMSTYLDPNTWHPRGLGDHFARFHAPAIQPTFDAIECLAEREGDLFVVFQTLLNGARIACEKHGLGYAQVLLSPSALSSDSSPSYPLRQQVSPPWRRRVMPQIRAKLDEQLMAGVVEPHINPVRTRGGMRPWSKAEIPREGGSECLVALFPEWFRSVPEDWPEQLVFAGFPLQPERRHSSQALVDAYVKEYGRVIAFTFGTGAPIDLSTIARAKHLCRVFDRPGVFASKNLGDVLPHLEERFLCVDYADFSHLFQVSDVVLHHGGIGTCAAAMRAGAPQLVAPFTFDQPDNAYWMHQLGLSNAVDFANDELHDLVAATEFLLTNEDVKKQVQRVRRKLRGRDGATVAAKHILKHVEASKRARSHSREYARSHERNNTTGENHEVRFG